MYLQEIQEKQKFDFENNKIQILDFETLKRTHKENDIYGNPLRGMYHYQVIEKVTELAQKHNLSYEVEEIFAAQNSSRQSPSVVILPQVEEQFGKNAIEAHILRRVFTTVKINDLMNGETCGNVVIANHQDGLQIAVGQRVMICKNQCILGAGSIFQNYGTYKIPENKMFESVENWFLNFAEYREKDLSILEKMKEITLNQRQIFELIGLLTALRVAHDTVRNAVITRENYPLNQSQISQFTENILRESIEKNKEIYTLWDIYNHATHLQKPDKMEISNIVPQNAEVFNVLKNHYEL
ncbi:MAG: DUF932 domain-containing protein [Prevotellaceae bacterium]|jgi:hypothetical protein|nr:DUF932 domain-containing protein [Prevotellaceae bacterium]